MEPFYYNHMNKNQQAAYRAMQQGLINLSDEFQIPRLEGKDLSNVFFELRLDHPEIFWASGFKYKYYPDSPNLILIPEYLFDKGKIREHQKAMGALVEKLARPAMKLTELEKERYIHDFICEHVHYDKLKKPYSHEIIGPLGQGVGVCEGIAKSVKILCDTLGIWCMIALCGNNPEKGIKYRHTWNIVKIGKTYYHLAATFDRRGNPLRLLQSRRQGDLPRPRTAHRPGACLHGQRSFLLQRKEAFLYQTGGRLQALLTGGQKRKNTDVSLARRLSDKGSSA